MSRGISTDTKSKRTPRQVMQDNLVFWADYADRLAAQIDALGPIEAGDTEGARMAELLRRELIAARAKSQQCAVELGPYEHGKINTVNPPQPAAAPFDLANFPTDAVAASVTYMRIIAGNGSGPPPFSSSPPPPGGGEPSSSP